MEQVSDFRRTAWVVNDGAVAVRLVGDRPHADQPRLHPGRQIRIVRPEQETLAAIDSAVRRRLSGAAMTQRSIVTVRLAEGLGNGIAALSGGSLACAVLCPAATAP